jgi:hypothetical protein
VVGWEIVLELGRWDHGATGRWGRGLLISLGVTFVWVWVLVGFGFDGYRERIVLGLRGSDDRFSAVRDGRERWGCAVLESEVTVAVVGRACGICRLGWDLWETLEVEGVGLGKERGRRGLPCVVCFGRGLGLGVAMIAE